MVFRRGNGHEKKNNVIVSIIFPKNNNIVNESFDLIETLFG